MANRTDVVGSSEPDRTSREECVSPDQIPPDAVRHQLERIVASELFVRSPRLTRFLRYAVEKTLDGQQQLLKEYSVARDVFDKPEEFDTRTDPIVRVEAQRLRGKLLEYYTSVGKTDPILIRFGRGYVPSFKLQAPPPDAMDIVDPPLISGDHASPGGSFARLPEGSGVAVLPFLDMTKDSAYGYFCDGLTQELINGLTAVEGLQVASRSSAFQFKGPAHDVRQVGRRLGVTAVLEGSVRKAGKKVRVTAQLTSASDGFHLWSESYDANMSDDLKVQEEIAARIVETLEARRGGPRPYSLTLRHTSSPAAYRAYLNGLYQMHGTRPQGLADAIACLEDAIEKDPEYVHAYAALANCWLKSAWFGDSASRESLPRAKAAALKALELDDSIGAAHATLGATYAVGDWNWFEAGRSFARAIDLDPRDYSAHHWYSIVFLAPLGRLDEASGAIRRAIELGPQSLYALSHFGLLHLYRGMAEEAIEQLRNVLLLKPEFVPALLDLGRAYVEQSAFDEAIEALSKANALAKNHPHILGTLGHCYAVMGKEKEARKIARDLGRRSAESASPSLALARVHAGLGDTDEAFRSMEQAVADRAARIIEIGVDPMFASLREDPRFRKIREEICLETPPKGRMKSGAAPSTSSPG